MTIVRPQARFGHIELQGDKITKFREKIKPQRVGLMVGFLF